MEVVYIYTKSQEIILLYILQECILGWNKFKNQQNNWSENISEIHKYYIICLPTVMSHRTLPAPVALRSLRINFLVLAKFW